jgi:transcriptional regulator with XRE-family HTH domain
VPCSGHVHCICHSCQGWRRKLARLAVIEPRHLVYADEARVRVEQLVSAGAKKSEVARRAGVSPALISKILKPGSSINEETAERILSVEAR